jgi:hypothetical protein
VFESEGCAIFDRKICSKVRGCAIFDRKICLNHFEQIASLTNSCKLLGLF